MHIVQVLINDDSDRTITGIIVYDRANGGTLTIPAGATFPTPETPGEIFWRTDQSILYRRDDGNSTWEAIQATPIAHAGTHIQGGTDEIDADQLDIDFAPANYTPSTGPVEVTDAEQLSAHLAGLDDALGALEPFTDLTTVTSTATQTVTNVFTGNTNPSGLFVRHNFNVVITQAGTFRLDYSYLWNQDSTFSDFVAQIVQDTTDLLYRHVEEPKDAAGGSVGGSGSGQLLPASGFVLLNLSPNTYNFQFQFGTSNGSREATVFRSDLMFYRVS